MMLVDNISGFVDLLGTYQSKRYLDDSNRAWLPSHQVWDLQLGLEVGSMESDSLCRQSV